MRNFQDLFEKRKRSFINAFSIRQATFISPSKFDMVKKKEKKTMAVAKLFALQANAKNAILSQANHQKDQLRSYSINCYLGHCCSLDKHCIRQEKLRLLKNVCFIIDKKKYPIISYCNSAWKLKILKMWRFQNVFRNTMTARLYQSLISS